MRFAIGHIIIRTALAIVAALIVVMILLDFLILPWIVRDKVQAQLQKEGLTDVSFHVPITTFGRAVITNVAVHNGSDRIKRIAVDYSIPGIRQGQINEIQISGLRLVLNVTPAGKLKPGPISSIFSRASNSSAATKPARPISLPFGRIDLADSQLVIKSPTQSTELPVSGSLAKSTQDQFAIKIQTKLGSPVTVQGALTPPAGNVHLEMAANQLDAATLTQLASTLLPSVNIGLDGTLAAAGQFTHASGQSSLVAQFTITNPGDQGSAGGPNLQLTSGIFKLSGNFGKGRNTLAINVSDAGLTQQSQSIDVAGITGDVTIDRFAPLGSPPNQRVQVKQVKKGDLVLNNGVIDFQVTGPQTIAIQHTQWNTLGGQVLANDATLKGSQLRAMVQAKQINLADILKTFARGKATGTGLLSGDVQLAVSPTGIAIAGGQFQSKTGGTLQITNPEQLVGENTTAQAGTQNEVTTRIMNALKDFQFTTLTAQLKHEPTGLAAYVHVVGHGRTGAKQGIDYTLRVHGLDPLLKAVLKLRGAISAAQNSVEKAEP